MIPKIIHACWFGSNEMPSKYIEFAKTRKEKNPEFEIKIWTLDSFKEYLDDSEFVNYCLQNKNYGFLSDYFRFVVLYNFGGVYLDTDVEAIKSFDEFLSYDLFIGYIFDCSLGTAIIGSKKGNEILLEMLTILKNDFSKYKKVTVSNEWVTKFFIENVDGFKLNGQSAVLPNDICICNKEYFERLNISKHINGGYTLHHCDGSWRKDTFSRKYIKPFIKALVGKKMYEKLTLLRLTKKQKYYSLYKDSV